MIGGVLSPLIQMSFSESAGPVVWPTEAFLSGDRPDTPASLVAELTGGARILVLRAVLLFAGRLMERAHDGRFLRRR